MYFSSTVLFVIRLSLHLLKLLRAQVPTSHLSLETKRKLDVKTRPLSVAHNSQMSTCPHYLRLTHSHHTEVLSSCLIAVLHNTQWGGTSQILLPLFVSILSVQDVLAFAHAAAV